MTRKILIASAVLGFALASFGFASGQKDLPAAAQVTAGQKLTLTGTVSLQNFMHPILKSGDKVYELLVPRFLVYESGVKEGAKVSVEGYPAQDMPRWSVSDDDGNIDVLVTKATIDGKEYDLWRDGGPMMGGPAYGRGHGPGMMGGGPGYGPGRGGFHRGWR